MTIESYEMQLERVQAAIAAIEGGAQDYQMGSRRVTKADLKTLYDRELKLRELVAMYGTDTDYGTRAYVGWGGRR